MIEKYGENSMIQVDTKTNRPKQGLMIVHYRLWRPQDQQKMEVGPKRKHRRGPKPEIEIG
jgi:hypothetical protein